MKILQIIQRGQLRGAEVFACQLSTCLRKMGHEVDVLILFGDKGGLGMFDLPMLELNANESRRFTDWGAYGRLAKLIKERKYDIVQANAGDTLKYVSFSKLVYRWNAKVVFRNANKMSDFLNSSFKLHFNKWLLHRIDFVASVSEECRLDFMQTFAWPAPAIETLPIGTNLPADHLPNPFAQMAVAAQKKILLSVAGFVPEKNHAGLLRIFKKVHDAHPGTLLALVGEGKLKASIMEQCDALALKDYVLFLGKRQDVHALMMHSSALLMPSLIEGLPGVILEAFACRLPVVAYNVGGIGEVVRNGHTGWLLEKHDEDGFVQALNVLLTSDKQYAEKLAANAYSLVTNEYSNEEISKRFAAAYTRLLKG